MAGDTNETRFHTSNFLENTIANLTQEFTEMLACKYFYFFPVIVSGKPPLPPSHPHQSNLYLCTPPPSGRIILHETTTVFVTLQLISFSHDIYEASFKLIYTILICVLSRGQSYKRVSLSCACPETFECGTKARLRLAGHTPVDRLFLDPKRRRKSRRTSRI